MDSDYEQHSLSSTIHIQIVNIFKIKKKKLNLKEVVDDITK